MKTIRIFNTYVLCSILFFSCSKEDGFLNQDVKFRKLDFDYNINDLEEQFENDVVKLGRVLFYDKQLSFNSTVSCGSCHKQEFAFADNVAKSEGFLKGPTKRNTPNLLNTKFNGLFFWDGRTFNFSNAVTMPLFDNQEMGMTSETLIDRVSNLDYYKDLFNDAYSSSKITGPRITLALVEFVGSIISANADIDQFLANEIWLENNEFKGMGLFREHCNDCHSVIGNEQDEDNPYFGVSTDLSLDSRVDIGLSFDKEEFLNEDGILRIPSLRNITSTAPYMHDGRFETLLEVVEHYDDEVVDRVSIDERLLDEEGKPKKLNLTDEDKENIISFLETLSDSTVEQAEKYSNPFL